MKYSKNNGTVEHTLFLVCYVLSFFLLYSFKSFLNELLGDGLPLFLVLFCMSIVIGNYVLFNLVAKFFFKLPWLKSTIVNFSGEWKGTGRSSMHKEFDISIKIDQTLVDMSINAYFAESKSEAVNCRVFIESNKEKLIYNYYNTPTNTAENLDKHYGTVILEKVENDKLVGNYFTDRKEQTKGALELTKQDCSPPGRAIVDDD